KERHRTLMVLVYLGLEDCGQQQRLAAVGGSRGSCSLPGLERVPSDHGGNGLAVLRVQFALGKPPPTPLHNHWRCKGNGSSRLHQAKRPWCADGQIQFIQFASEPLPFRLDAELPIQFSFHSVNETLCSCLHFDFVGWIAAAAAAAARKQRK